MDNESDHNINKLNARKFKNNKFSKNSSFLHLNRWLNFPKNRKYIRYRFLTFIFGTIDMNTGSNFYIEQLKEIYFNKKTSFFLCFEHLVLADPLLSIWVTDEPEIVFKIFKETCEEILRDIFQKKNGKCVIFIRLYGLPIFESIRNLKKKKSNCLVKIRGYVTSKTHIFPTVAFFKLFCLKCFETQDELFSTGDSKNLRIKNCFNCKSLGPFRIKWDKLVTNEFQKISIREECANHSFYCFPYSIEIILTGDLMGCVDYGDKIEVTGIFKYSVVPSSNSIIKCPSFFNLIEGNFIQKVESLENFSKILPFEIRKLEKLVEERKLLSSLLHSFIPSIFENYFIKLLIVLTFCSYNPSSVKGKNSGRDCINMLIFGDFCTGKSTVLKAIYDFFPQSRFFTGHGTSIKGLTVSYKHDKITGTWISEGGVLTIIKKGLCLIDGLEGMETKDVNTLCKILDQSFILSDQSPSSKKICLENPTIATINNFNIIYNPSLPFSLNYGIDESVISKFDIIYEMEKIQNFETEKNIAQFLINKFQKLNNFKEKSKIFLNHSKYTDYQQDSEKLSVNFMLRYLNYCRNNFTPKYGILDQSFILKFYLELKRETKSLNSLSFSSNFLETMTRIISSCAKLHLRNQISEKDLAIGLIIFFESWTQIQPYFTKNFLRSKYGKFFSNIFQKYDDCIIFLNKNWIR